MGTHANGVTCGMVKWVKRNTLSWFGHTEKKNEEFVKKVYPGEAVGTDRRGRPTWEMER